MEYRAIVVVAAPLSLTTIGLVDRVLCMQFVQLGRQVVYTVPIFLMVAVECRVETELCWCRSYDRIVGVNLMVLHPGTRVLEQRIHNQTSK
jgi:hypothetical protein